MRVARNILGDRQLQPFVVTDCRSKQITNGCELGILF
jgi:hypothetical protein